MAVSPPFPARKVCSTAPSWVPEVRSWPSVPTLCTLCPDGAAANRPHSPAEPECDGVQAAVRVGACVQGVAAEKSFPCVS